jgi:hypothetical protein
MALISSICRAELGDKSDVQLVVAQRRARVQGAGRPGCRSIPAVAARDLSS